MKFVRLAYRVVSSTVITACVLVYLCPTISAVTIDGFTYNDLTGDGNCDSADVILLNQYLSGKFDPIDNIDDFDVTGNYVIDIVDATAYLRYYVTQIM